MTRFIPHLRRMPPLLCKKLSHNMSEIIKDIWDISFVTEASVTHKLSSPQYPGLGIIPSKCSQCSGSNTYHLC